MNEKRTPSQYLEALHPKEAAGYIEQADSDKILINTA
jgi:hypothetical protein